MTDPRIRLIEELRDELWTSARMGEPAGVSHGPFDEVAARLDAILSTSVYAIGIQPSVDVKLTDVRWGEPAGRGDALNQPIAAPRSGRDSEPDCTPTSESVPPDYTPLPVPTESESDQPGDWFQHLANLFGNIQGMCVDEEPLTMIDGYAGGGRDIARSYRERISVSPDVRSRLIELADSLERGVVPVYETVSGKGRSRDQVILLTIAKAIREALGKPRPRNWIPPDKADGGTMLVAESVSPDPVEEYRAWQRANEAPTVYSGTPTSESVSPLAGMPKPADSEYAILSHKGAILAESVSREDVEGVGGTDPLADKGAIPAQEQAVDPAPTPSASPDGYVSVGELREYVEEIRGDAQRHYNMPEGQQAKDEFGSGAAAARNIIADRLDSLIAKAGEPE